MKTLRGFWVIGVVAIALVLIGQGTASATVFPYTLTVNIDGIASYTWSGTGSGAYNVSPLVNGKNWYINEYVSVGPGAGPNDPDWLYLQSVTTFPAAAKLTVTLTEQFSTDDPFLTGTIFAHSTGNQGEMKFAGYIGGVTGGLGPFTGNFNTSGPVPIYANGVNTSYVASMQYVLTNSAGLNTLDEVTLGVVPAPEPATLLLLGAGLAGLAGLGALRRR